MFGIEVALYRVVPAGSVSTNLKTGDKQCQNLKQQSKQHTILLEHIKPIARYVGRCFPAYIFTD